MFSPRGLESTPATGHDRVTEGRARPSSPHADRGPERVQHGRCGRFEGGAVFGDWSCCTCSMSTAAHGEQSPFQALGRFLGVGVVGGSMVGTAAGLILTLPGSSEYWSLGVLFGVPIGLVAGLVAQALTFTAVMALARPTESANPRLVMAIPVPLAAVAVWAIASSLAATSVQVLASTGVAAVLTLAAVVLTARWCVEPLAASSATSIPSGQSMVREPGPEDPLAVTGSPLPETSSSAPVTVSGHGPTLRCEFRMADLRRSVLGQL